MHVISEPAANRVSEEEDILQPADPMDTPEQAKAWHGSHDINPRWPSVYGSSDADLS